MNTVYSCSVITQCNVSTSHSHLHRRSVLHASVESTPCHIALHNKYQIMEKQKTSQCYIIFLVKLDLMQFELNTYPAQKAMYLHVKENRNDWSVSKMVAGLFSIEWGQRVNLLEHLVMRAIILRLIWQWWMKICEQAIKRRIPDYVTCFKKYNKSVTTFI